MDCSKFKAGQLHILRVKLAAITTSAVHKRTVPKQSTNAHAQKKQKWFVTTIHNLDDLERKSHKKKVTSFKNFVENYL
jgi:hypothetical protein